jgi:uncharacterized protein (DUF4415 family)
MEVHITPEQHHQLAQLASQRGRIPALGKSFLKKATTAWPPEKKQLTIRLDADVLA